MFETKSVRPGSGVGVERHPAVVGVVTWAMDGIGVDNEIYQRKGISVLVR